MKKIIILFFVFFLVGCVFDRNIDTICFQPEVSSNVDDVGRETHGTFAFRPGTEISNSEDNDDTDVADDIHINDDISVTDDTSSLLSEVMSQDIDPEDVMSDTKEEDITTLVNDVFMLDDVSQFLQDITDDDGDSAMPEEILVDTDIQETTDVPSFDDIDVADNNVDSETTPYNGIVDVDNEDVKNWSNDISEEIIEVSNEDSMDTSDVEIEDVLSDTKDVPEIIELSKCDAVDCNDKNPCTNDSCDQQMGCLFVTNVNPCDDNNWCTDNDICTLGKCKGTPHICVIPESIPCYIGVCNPSKSECVFNQGDNDQDGIFGGCDSDLDNDGIPNIADSDDDNDGIPDIVDNCAWKFNPAQVDSDGDGLGFGDTCDPDGNNG